MKIEVGPWANCSEAVFRFYTLDPKKMQLILQALADEISATTDFDAHKGQSVPLVERPEEYEGTVLQACAGLGSNDCEVTIERERESFVLNIGNNDISGNNTSWIECVQGLGIRVEEAGYSPVLEKAYARDCCCGITYFDGYKGLIKNPERAVFPEWAPECHGSMYFSKKDWLWHCADSRCGTTREPTEAELECLESEGHISRLKYKVRKALKEERK